MERRARFSWGGLTAPALLWVLLLFFVPMGFVVASSVATTDIVGRPVFGWYPDSYDLLLETGVLTVVARSAFSAGLATVICVALGYPTAYAISTYGGRYRTGLILLVLVPWLADYLIRIYAWVQLFGEDGLGSTILQAIGLSNDQTVLGTTAAVIVGLVYNVLPLMILSIYVAIEQLDRRLVEAARDLGASATAAFWKVVVPNTMTGVTTGSLIVFLLSLGDWATVSLLGGAGNYMIGNLIEDQLSSTGSLPIGAAATVALVVSIVASVVIVRLLMKLRDATKVAMRRQA